MLMDTGSHLLFGFTLAGLSYLDPAVSGDPTLAQAVMVGTVVGSNAPDFDSVVRLKGYSAYIRHHRGITHSIPAWFVWPAVIGVPLAAGYQVWDHFWTLYGWIWLSIVFHVILDLFNTYGVQIARPFAKKWFHLDILAIFEPFLFTVHLGGLWWWYEGADPRQVFGWVYAVTVGYIAVRSWHHRRVIDRVHRETGLAGVCHVLPTFHWFHWLFVVETEDGFYTGKVSGRSVKVEDFYPKAQEHTAIRASMKTDGVRAFLSFAQWVHVTCRELQDGYEVVWSDVRFWYDKKLPFGVNVRLDKHGNVMWQRLGWRKRLWDPPFV
jgi:inner membrane protein